MAGYLQSRGYQVQHLALLMHFTLLTHVMKVLWKTSVELALEFGNYTSNGKRTIPQQGKRGSKNSKLSIQVGICRKSLLKRKSTASVFENRWNSQVDLDICAKQASLQRITSKLNAKKHKLRKETLD